MRSWGCPILLARLWREGGSFFHQFNSSSQSCTPCAIRWVNAQYNQLFCLHLLEQHRTHFASCCTFQGKVVQFLDMFRGDFAIVEHCYIKDNVSSPESTQIESHDSIDCCGESVVVNRSQVDADAATDPTFGGYTVDKAVVKLMKALHGAGIL